MTLVAIMGADVAFTVRDHTYHLIVLDEQEMGREDPTLLIFRDDEEEAVITAHLDPRARCNDGHVVVREGEDA